MLKTIADLLREHEFFEGISEEDLALIAGCGRLETVEAGQFLAHEGDSADYFYIIRKGRVTLETFIPGGDSLVVQTLQKGDVLGWSWLFPPYQWSFDIRVLKQVHLVALDGKCLRGKCETDEELGFELMKRFAKILHARLQATRLQILDVYGNKSA